MVAFGDANATFARRHVLGQAPYARSVAVGRVGGQLIVAVGASVPGVLFPSATEPRPLALGSTVFKATSPAVQRCKSHRKRASSPSSVAGAHLPAPKGRLDRRGRAVAGYDQLDRRRGRRRRPSERKSPSGSRGSCHADRPRDATPPRRPRGSSEGTGRATAAAATRIVRADGSRSIGG